MILPLRRYAVFTGRARPKEYWMYVLFLILAYIVLSIVEGVLGLGQSSQWASHQGWSASAGVSHNGGPLVWLFALGTFIPSLAVGVRRLHDTDRSGWWLLLALIPLIGGIILLVFMVSGGTRGVNRFGADPLEEVPTNVVG
ncbi:MAG: DUF805 domain-containing protein [Sphingobium sp.]